MTDSSEHATATELARKVLLLCSEVEDKPSNWAFHDESEEKEAADDVVPCTTEAGISSSEMITLRNALVRTRKNAAIKYRKLEIERASLSLELANARLELEQANLALRKSRAERDGLRRDLEKSVRSKADLAQMLGDENCDMIQSLDTLRGERDELRQDMLRTLKNLKGLEEERDELRRENDQLKNWINIARREI